MEVYENTESITKLNNFWENARIEMSQIKTDQMTFKSQELPLARIKKIMKLDEDVKSMMISAEAPILFAKAAELFIREITLRAWIHTERNKRRTLQRSDITLAVGDGDTDQFDFLIDIVPRDEINKSHGGTAGGSANHGNPGAMINQTGTLTGVGLSTKREETAGSVTTTGHLTTNHGIVFTNTNTSSTASMVQQPTATIIDSSHHHQNIITTQGTQGSQPVQYVLQLPVGATTNSLTSGQAIQIQMIPQQTILAAATPNDNVVTSQSADTTTRVSVANVLSSQMSGHTNTVTTTQLVPSSGTIVLPTSTSNVSTTAISVPTSDDSINTVQLHVSNGNDGTGSGDICAVTPSNSDNGYQGNTESSPTVTTVGVTTSTTTSTSNTDHQQSENVIIKTEFPSPRSTVDEDQ